MVTALEALHVLQVKETQMPIISYKMESADKEAWNRFLKALLDVSCILPYSSKALINTVVMIENSDKSDSLRNETNM